MRELTIGFDLGTSTSKVVVRDISRDLAYQVPIGENGSFVLGTVLYYNPTTEIFSLERPEHEEVWLLYDIKNYLVSSDLEVDQIIASAYVACVLRKVLKWMFLENIETRKRYDADGMVGAAPSGIEWTGNIGIPVNCAERTEWDMNARIRDRFRLVLRAGFIIAINEMEVSRLSSRTELERAKNDDSYEVHQDFFQAATEVVAQGLEYMESRYRSSGLIALVDIGAATVDIAVMNMVRGDEMSHHIYYSKVAPHGLYRVVRSIQEGRGIDFMQWLDGIGGHGANIPKEILNMPLVAVTKWARDNSFEKDMHSYYIQAIKQLKQKDTLDTWNWRTEKITTYFTGGGSQGVFYHDQIKQATEHAQPMNVAGYDVKEFPMDPRFEMYDRTCTAHGLSRRYEDLAKVKCMEVLEQLEYDDDESLPRDFGLDWNDKDVC